MFKHRATRKLIPVLPKNYRSIGLAAIDRAVNPIVLMNKKIITDYSEQGNLTQKGIGSLRNFEVRDGRRPILGFHDHPDEMWISDEYANLATECESHGWLTIQGQAS